MSTIWTDAENDYIRKNANHMKDKEMAENLTKISGRTIKHGALTKHRQRLKIRKISGRGRCGVQT